MTKFQISAFTFLVVLLFSSCTVLDTVSIDYMTPGVMTFPPELRKVGVVNNTSDQPDNELIINKEDRHPESQYQQLSVTYANGHPQITTQTLANEIADQNYFETVVICDSALRSKDILPRENMLSQQEVQTLTNNLGVDFIIALENLQIKATKSIVSLPEYDCYGGSTDVTVYPKVAIYLPMRNKPIAVITSSDSIFWNQYGASISETLTHMIPDKEMLDQASDFAGTVPIKMLLPVWQKDTRYIYSGGSSQMNDAAIYVKENLWNNAYELWNDAYNTTKSDKKKMKLALNIAVSYEMNDNVPKAKEWVEKSIQHAVNAGLDKSSSNSFNRQIYDMINSYNNKLQEREEQYAKLKLQMERFNNDF